jgi:hypothetical protein
MSMASRNGSTHADQGDEGQLGCMKGGPDWAGGENEGSILKRNMRTLDHLATD